MKLSQCWSRSVLLYGITRPKLFQFIDCNYLWTCFAWLNQERIISWYLIWKTWFSFLGCFVLLIWYRNIAMNVIIIAHFCVYFFIIYLYLWAHNQACFLPPYVPETYLQESKLWHMYDSQTAVLSRPAITAKCTKEAPFRCITKISVLVRQVLILNPIVHIIGFSDIWIKYDTIFKWYCFWNKLL